MRPAFETVTTGSVQTSLKILALAVLASLATELLMWWL